MELFNVYPRFDIELTKGAGVYVYDEKGQKYLDLYGGHGVISIGHQHPNYVKRLEDQLHKIGFYSNSVKMPIQEELAKKLGKLSGYDDYNLFLCNSGAEANENALKLASFHTGKSKIIAFRKSFHGRTSGTLSVTDNPNLSAPINKNESPVSFLEMNDLYTVKEVLKKGDVAGIIIEGIQGVGGLDMPTTYFLEKLSALSKEYGALLILDEIQSGFGRSGKFFAHQHAHIKADIISVAKGMGNGFPVGGVLISPQIKAESGMLGTTFGGNHLACSATLAVLETIKEENLLEQVSSVSSELLGQLKELQVKSIKGKGLMLGVEFDFPVGDLRKKLLFDHHIFTGASANPNLLRILPPLNITSNELAPFVEALQKELAYENV